MNIDTPISNSTNKNSKNKIAWLILASYVFLVVLLLILNFGAILLPLFPLSSLLIGFYLYIHNPELYVGFTLWLWFVSPLVRRILQLQTSDGGGLTIVPTLVAFISLLYFAKYLPGSFFKDGIPFFLCIASIIYVSAIGVIQNPISLVIIRFLPWTAPVAFGFYLSHNWQRYPQYRLVIQNVFLWATVVMGIYGVYQFVVAPPWDSNWLIANDIISRGRPEAFQIRVWSTTEDSRTFGGIMMASLILSLSNRMSKPIYIPALVFGTISLLLSSVRSAWLGLLIGLSVYFLSLKAKLQIRLLIIISFAVLVILVLTSFEQISTIISKRFSSFSNLEDDISYQHRAEQLNELIGQAFAEVVGRGFGYDLRGLKVPLSSGDNNFLAILFWFGWVGCIPYFTGVILISILVLSIPNTHKDNFLWSIKSVVISLLPLIIGLPIFSSSLGMILWSCFGMGLASKKYSFFSKIHDSHHVFLVEDN